MIEIPTTKVYRACLFVDDKGGTPSENTLTDTIAYQHIRDTLLQYVARFDFEQDVRPFQLRYRPFNLYLCDIGGWDTGRRRFMQALGNVIPGRLSRVFLFWTGETWDEFCTVNSDLVEYECCINACDRDWMEKVTEYLQNQE